jgi:hypothetical protein
MVRARVHNTAGNRAGNTARVYRGAGAGKRRPLRLFNVRRREGDVDVHCPMCGLDVPITALSDDDLRRWYRHHRTGRSQRDSVICPNSEQLVDETRLGG